MPTKYGNSVPSSSLPRSQNLALLAHTHALRKEEEKISERRKKSARVRFSREQSAGKEREGDFFSWEVISTNIIPVKL